MLVTEGELLDAAERYAHSVIEKKEFISIAEQWAKSLNNGKPIVSGSLPPFPDWNEAIKGIDDSRFTTLDGRYEVREGARIMYDRLYSMLTRRQ